MAEEEKKTGEQNNENKKQMKKLEETGQETVKTEIQQESVPEQKSEENGELNSERNQEMKNSSFETSAGDAEAEQGGSESEKAAETSAGDAETEQGEQKSEKAAETSAGDAETEQGESESENEAAEDLKERTKMKWVIGFGAVVMILAIIVLAWCVVYSLNINRELVGEITTLEEQCEDLQTLLEEKEAELAAAEEAAEEEEAEEEVTVTPEPTQEPAEDNFEAVERNLQEQAETGTADTTTEESEEKVITSTEPDSEYVTYEGTINGTKFSFQYPSEWDGRIIFAGVENEDGTMVITCYQSGQYNDYQNGATETGEIFHLYLTQDSVYQTESNNQYKIAEGNGYSAYYEEPTGVTYDYINHIDYAQDYQLVYETQAKVWRTFQFG